MGREEKSLLCLIDAQNIYYTPKQVYHAQIDFAKLLEQIQADVNQAVYPIIYLVADAATNQVPFMEVLQKLGYMIRIKLMWFENGTAKNTNWDAEIIEDARAMMPFHPGIVLVSGDHGFIPVLDEWQAAGKSTRVYCFERDVSTKVVQSQHVTNFLGREVMQHPHFFH